MGKLKKYMQTGGGKNKILSLQEYGFNTPKSETSFYKKPVPTKQALAKDQEANRLYYKQILNERKRKLAESNAAKNNSNRYSSENIAKETQSIGDKFRIFPNDPNSFIDDYLNPGVMIGDMASGVGQIPLNLKQGDYGQATLNLAAPIIAGATAGIGAKSTGQFVNNIVNPLAGTGDLINNLGNKYLPNVYKLNPSSFKTSADKFYRQVDNTTYNEGLESGLIRGKQDVDMTKDKDIINLNKFFGDDAYYNKGSLYYKNNKDLPYLFEANLPEENFIPKVNGRTKKYTTENTSVRVSKEPLPINHPNITIYKKDWLKGYKQIKTPKNNYDDISINHKQVGGKTNSAIVENKEYVKTLAGEVLKIKDAPRHEDKILKVNNVNKKVTSGKGGVLMPNIESAISATHENRTSKSKLYTQKDEEIKIMPTEVKAIGKMLALPIKLQKKAISPAKLLDLLVEKRNTTIKKYKDPINDRDSNERFNAIAANRSVLATLPTKEDLYDVVFELQESKKSPELNEVEMQTGGDLDKLINRKKKYFQKEENLGKYPKTKELYTAQQGLSTGVYQAPSVSKFLQPKVTNNQAEKRLLNTTKQGFGNLERLKDDLSDFNDNIEQGYVNDKNLLTIKDLKYNKRHNQSSPQTLVKDIARAAKVSGVPLETALAIAQRETGLGSQTYHPQGVYSNWESRYMGIPNSRNNEPGDQLTEEELAKVQSYAKQSLKYPFASEMDTIKKKTSKYGLRGYNYGDPDYPNKVAQEVEILRNPVNSKFMNYADSVYNATPKNYFDKKQTGGKLKKYM